MALGLFEGFGVELEYMIVDRETLSVKPVCDELLRAVTGEYAADAEMGELAWSNELALHVVELKTNGPAASLTGLSGLFDDHVRRVNGLLEGMGARLMPGAMHPWMDPARELRLWPHEYSAVYAAFDRVFSCTGHGWANLQSAHLNLPFDGDAQFGRLHAALRVLLPIMPALAAASPVYGSRLTAISDNRLEVYRGNCRRVPSVCGEVVPEPAYTRAEYERAILGRIYADLAPHDPEGVLRYEWVNARGVIARFDRSALEVRVLDVQECPAADLAVIGAVSGAARALTEERWTDRARQDAAETGVLARIFLDVVREGERALIRDLGYLSLLGVAQRGPVSAGEVWESLISRGGDLLEGMEEPVRRALSVILGQGTLSTRLRRALGRDGASGEGEVDRALLAETYGRLCDCLASGESFE